MVNPIISGMATVISSINEGPHQVNYIKSKRVYFAKVQVTKIFNLPNVS